MQDANAQTVLGNFDRSRFSYAGVTSTFFTRDGKFFVNTDGPGGTLADYEVKYTFGVTPLQQYLIEFPGGRYQALGIAWDTRPKGAGGQRWFHLYPNENVDYTDQLHWTGLYQNWNLQCAACHSTNLRKGYDTASNTYKTTFSEINVACEACHGPASNHVAWAAARAGETPARTEPGSGFVVELNRRNRVSWTIDPSTGSPRANPTRAALAEIEVCAPCHMRRSVIGDDHGPGRPLLDSYLPALLTEGLYHADGQIEGEVYEYGSFLQSKMYQAGVACSDCHEPHSLQLHATGDGVCARCHAPAKFGTAKHHFHPAGSKGASCIGCHMPASTFMVIDSRRDHSLRVPRPDLSVTLGTPNACAHCHTDQSAAWAAAQVRKWYGRDAKGYQTYAAALHAGRTGSAGVEEQLATLVRDTAQSDIARATGLSLLGRYPGPALLSAARQAARDADPLVRCSAAAALDALVPAERLAVAAPLLADRFRAVRIEAARQLAELPSDQISADLRSAIERGVYEYIAAQRVDADRPEAHTNLGTLFATRGEFAISEPEFRTAIALDPAYTPAYVNLADLYRVLEREDNGERILREGLAIAPDDAALRHALGLLLVRRKRLADAINELERAAKLQPDEARYGYVFAVALNSAGRSDAALDMLRVIHARRPGDRDVLWALATISRDSERPQDAQLYARRLAEITPDDPQVQQLLRQLGPAEK
jgi:tetratricopeptide (TPR) repeat protein